MLQTLLLTVQTKLMGKQGWTECYLSQWTQKRRQHLYNLHLYTLKNCCTECTQRLQVTRSAFADCRTFAAITAESCSVDSMTPVQELKPFNSSSIAAVLYRVDSIVLTALKWPAKRCCVAAKPGCKGT